MVLSECDAYGWAAAVVSMMAFGSFGVPIKSEAARSVDIDPLVFQSYKTLLCFLTSWFILLLPGQTFSFTPWGIVSGVCWVPAGVATIYAVKAAGLAVGIGVGSSCIVLISFVWGIFVFDEHVTSKRIACVAIVFMMVGICGMAFVSSPEQNPMTFLEDDRHDTATPPNETVPYNSVEESQSRSSGYHGIQREDLDSFSDDVDLDQLHQEPDTRIPPPPPFDGHVILGRQIPKRTLGIAAAVFCGIWGGSIMVPMHFASKTTTGIEYTISFAIGASIITIALWILRFFHSAFRTKSLVKAYHSMPSFHIRVMWLAGSTSGILWSIGNFFSLIAVQCLGEGVGYSVVQAGMLVSGLWGICYFREMVQCETIFLWMSFATLTVLGILLLSYEHHQSAHV